MRISFRQLAKAVNCSDSYIRHLDMAAQAPPLGQALARQGKISTRELAKRPTHRLFRQLPRGAAHNPRPFGPCRG